MILATEGPIASTLYYGIDDNFNLYIVTSPNSEHGKMFLKNPKVAYVITDTNQKMFATKYKIGVQVKEVVEQVLDKDLINTLDVWSHSNKEITEEFFKNISKGR